MTGLFRELPDEAASFPRARVPMLPVLDSGVWWPRRADRPSSRFFEEPSICLRSGRAALTAAYSLSGVRNGGEVLLPAYHCGAMVEPVLWLGAKPVFYRLTAGLAVDMDDLRSKLRSTTSAVVSVHYFGFHQEMLALRAECDRLDIALIEDCAHAFFDIDEEHPIGRTGDLAFSSNSKFFPCVDGGVLAVNRERFQAPPLEKPSLGQELKAALDTLETASDYGRGWPLGELARAAARVARRMGGRRSATTTTASEQGRGKSSEGWFWLNPSELGVEASRCSRLLMRSASTTGLAARRRENFRYLVERLRSVPGATPLHAELPPGVVPYVFPLVVAHPERIFTPLKRLGVPIWRWEQLAPSDCEVSAGYGQRLFQLPCNQSVTREELSWIADCFERALREGAAATKRNRKTPGYAESSSDATRG